MRIPALSRLALLAMSILICRSCHAEPGGMTRFQLAGDGSVRFWMLCLPFANPEGADAHAGSMSALDRDYLAPVGGERDAAPIDGQVVTGAVNGSEAKWHGQGFTDHVNLWLHTPVKDNVTGYAFCYLDADSDTPVTLKLGSSDATSVRLNGETVLTDPVERAPAPGLAKVDVILRKGLNRLLVKSCQAQYEWGFYFQVVAGDGKAPSGVRIALPIPPRDVPDSVAYPSPRPDALPHAKAPIYVTAPIRSDARIHVRVDRLRDPVKIAVEKLVGRMRGLGVNASMSVGSEVDSGADLVVELDGSAGESFSVRRVSDQLVVRGVGTMGVVYGLAFLQSRLWKESGRGACWHLDASSRTYSPEFRKRGIYVMYGYNFHDIEVHDWTPAQWRTYIDELVQARLNYLYIYVWTSEWSAMPGSKGDNPRNRRMHETIRSAIRYAHRRGLKVCHMFTPTLLPSDLYDTARDAFSDKPTVPGWKFACASKPRGRELMERLTRAEMSYFREADSFQCAFFDPGGCLCDKCTRDTAETLLDQAKRWAAVVRGYNPKAELSLNFWPFKVAENEYKLTFANRLLDLAKREFGPSIDICEAADLERVYLHTAKEQGFRTTAFIFPTNPETSYFLPIISGDLWKPMLSRMYHEWGFDGALFQRMEAKTRGVEDYIMGNLYWDTSADPDTLLHTYACSLIGDSGNGARFASVLKGIDEFTSVIQEPGSAHKIDLAAGIEQNLRDLAPCLPKDKRWYAGLGPVYSDLGRGIYAQSELNTTLNPAWQKEIDSRKATFIRHIQSAPLYHDALPDKNVVAGLFDSYTAWLAVGRRSTMW